MSLLKSIFFSVFFMINVLPMVIPNLSAVCKGHWEL